MDTNNPDCWLTLWADADCKGNSRTFTGAGPVYNLSEYAYTNTSDKINDSSDSLLTGPSTWACLFVGSNFEGDVLRVGPGTTLQDLNEVKRNGGDFKHQISSFVLYDECPNFWTPADDTQAGDCWLKLYMGPRYTAERYAVHGAGDIISISCIAGLPLLKSSQYYYPASLTTGPNTWVELFKDIDFKKPLCSFGPNSLIPDLTLYNDTKAHNEYSGYFRSLRVYNQAPTGFNAGARLPAELVAVQHYQTSKRLNHILDSAINLVPGAGPALSKVLDTLWPTGPSTAEVWHDMASFMQNMAEGLVDQNNVARLNDLLSGYCATITTYSTMVDGPLKATSLQGILQRLQTDQHLFLDQAHPETTLPYLVAFGTLCVQLLAERAYNFTTRSGGQPDRNVALARQSLDQAIATFTQAVHTAVSRALAWRLAKITVTTQGSLHTNYAVEDTYTGYSQQFSTQTQAQQGQQVLSDYIGEQYNQLLQGYASPAAMWGAFATANTTEVADSGNPNFPTTAFVQAPITRNITGQLGMYPPAARTGQAFSEDTNGHRIVGVTLYASGANKDGFLTGIQFRYDAQSSGLHGKPGASNVQVTLDPDEDLVAFYGGNGLYIDQLFFRTSKGRDFGLGGAGGHPYLATLPQGVGTAISRLSGYIDGNYLGSLALTWAYAEDGLPGAG